MSRERLLTFPPLRFRMSPQNAEPTAGGIHQHPIYRWFAHSDLFHGGRFRCLDYGNPIMWLSNIADDRYDNLDPESTAIASQQIQTRIFPIDGVDGPLVMHQVSQMGRLFLPAPHRHRARCHQAADPAGEESIALLHLPHKKRPLEIPGGRAQSLLLQAQCRMDSRWSAWPQYLSVQISRGVLSLVVISWFTRRVSGGAMLTPSQTASAEATPNRSTHR